MREVDGHSDTARYESVRDYYGKVLKTSKDLKTSACTAGGRPHAIITKAMRLVPDEVLERFYGCGAPIPLGIKGLRVLDLGSGSGRDCYICAALVGETGFVIGLDMTDEQLQVAERHVSEYTQRLGFEERNMRFLKGHMEFLGRAGIVNESVDIIISNCVINLSPDKPCVLREAYHVLASGGELYFSDVYSDRRVPTHIQRDKVLWGECIGGALYIKDFMAMAKEAGFLDPRILSVAPIAINDAGIRSLLGETKFYSVTFRLFKAPELLEPGCEDYGQIAYYKGTIEGHEQSYTLDHNHTFEKHRPTLVCGNTAAMLGESGISWLSRHFEIEGSRSRHFGEFKCAPTPSLEKLASGATSQCGPSGGGCC